MKRAEALEIINAILQDIITSAEHLLDKQAAPNLDDGEKTSDYELEDDFEILFEITESERETDNSSRLKILLGLLELACAMVCIYHSATIRLSTYSYARNNNYDEAQILSTAGEER